MRRDALFQRFELFIAAATLAAHATQERGYGFRQRDVKFLTELFSNWIESSLPSNTLDLQNTQVARYLKQLVKDGYARESRRDRQPGYQLTRVGLIQLAATIVDQKLLLPFDHMFFLFYFLANYRPKIIALIEREGTKFPIALKLELESLLDCKAVLREQISFARRELAKLAARVNDAQRMQALACDMFKKGRDISEVASEIERLYPYGLNNQRTFSELLSSLPSATARWELEVGSMKRARQIWQPSSNMMERYLDILEKLSS